MNELRPRQEFCQCAREDGFTFDTKSKLWVCGTCGLPTYAHYVAAVRTDSTIGVARGYKVAAKRGSATRRG